MAESLHRLVHRYGRYDNDSTSGKWCQMNTVAEKTGVIDDTVGSRLAGKYLTFVLNKEEFAIGILNVNQILRLQPITSIPRTPPYVRGIINLRGAIIPIIDLRKKFSADEYSDTDNSCIVIIRLDSGRKTVNTGIVIDEVREVLEIPAGDIEETPGFDIGIDTSFIMGIAKTGEKVKMLLDISNVLSSAEMHMIAAISDKPEKETAGEHSRK